MLLVTSVIMSQYAPAQQASPEIQSDTAESTIQVGNETKWQNGGM